MYNIKTLANDVSIIIVILDNICVYVYDFFSPTVICNISFITLPPSKGYIGIKLNIPISRLEYMIVW